MNYKKSSEISDEMHDRIISVAYGNASFLEKRRIEKLASKNKIIRELLDEYKTTADVVHSIPPIKYDGKLKIKTIPDSEKSILDDIYQILIENQLVTAAATFLIVFTISFSIFNNSKVTYDGYTFSEVKRANLESKQAFQIVNQIFRKTKDKLKNDILIKEIGKPIKDGINTVDKLFKQENRNEQNEKKS